jgi:predicted small lipoprotein YifL
MKRSTYLLLATLLAAIALASCGPKPPPGQPDRDHADDAFGQLKK